MGKLDTHSFALALGAGAAKGLAHIGALMVLEREGLRPDRVAGTSIGALIGALYCLEPDAARLEKLALQFEDIPLRTLFLPRFSTSGLIDARRVRTFLEPYFGTARFDDVKLPFVCVAVDIGAGRPVILERGLLLDAVMASIAIPVVFPPQRRGGRFLVDGGLIDPVPVDVLRRRGAQQVVAVSLFAPGRRRLAAAVPKRKGEKNNAPWERRLITGVERLLGRLEKRSAGPHMLASLLATLEIMQKEVVRAHLQTDPPDVLIDVNTAGFAFHEFYRPAELMHRGEEAVRRVLPELRRLVSGGR